MYALKCNLLRLATLAALPLILTLAACGGGAAGGAALPDKIDPPDSQLIAQPAVGNAPLDVNFQFVFTRTGLSDVTYQWEWDTNGDGTMDMLTDGGPAITLHFDEPGEHKVKLTVHGKDADGNNVVIHKEITVEAK